MLPEVFEGNEVVDGMRLVETKAMVWSTSSIASTGDAERQLERPGRRWSSGAVTNVDLLRD
jgi:hypothetical protein